MGSQCSNLYEHITRQTTSRSRICDFVSNATQLSQNKSEQLTQFHSDIDLKLQFVKKIEGQLIQQNSKNLTLYEKYPQNRFIVKFSDGSQYKGCIDSEGRRQKQGQQTWADGTKYIGYWKQNLPHDHGILVSPNGFTFQGDWNKGIVQGFGKYYGRLGSYEGNWLHNQPNGFGIETWEDGSRYQGHYYYGKKQGKGKYIWPDKSSYNGEWSAGVITGFGVYQYVDDRIYKGSFKENKMHGSGTYKWPDGRKYIGSYQNDKKQGVGKYFWPDGRYYQGQWREGKRNGYGKVVYPNGLIKYGIWEDDTKIQDSSQSHYKINKVQQTLIDSENGKNSFESRSMSFGGKKTEHNVKNHSPEKLNRSLMRRSFTIPKTQGRPLYASSISPYKQLRNYYQQINGQAGDMKERVLNRYKFINSPFKNFNDIQLTGGGSYLSIQQEKNRVQNANKNVSAMQRDQILKNGTKSRGKFNSRLNLNDSIGHSQYQRRDSSFV